MGLQKRRAVSPILATVVLVAVTIAIAGIVLVMTTDMTKTQLSSDSLDIVSSKISNTDTESYLTISVKNTGNTEITNLVVNMNGFSNTGNNPTEFSFSPDTIRPGKSSSLTNALPELISEGKSMLAIVTGNTTSGGTVSETQTIRP